MIKKSHLKLQFYYKIIVYFEFKYINAVFIFQKTTYGYTKS